MSLIERGDGAGACIRLLDREGQLFAAAPLPSDCSIPLTTVVDPVVDSSRYFVLRVEDEATRVHAFIGLGFRERTDASDFTAALDDWRKFLYRRKQAEEMRTSSQAGGAGDDPYVSSAGQSYALGEDEPLKVNIKIKETGKVGLLSRQPITLPGISNPEAGSFSSSRVDPLPEEDDWGDFVTG